MTKIILMVTMILIVVAIKTAIMITMIKIILIVVIINNTFQPGDFSTGSTTGWLEEQLNLTY